MLPKCYQDKNLDNKEIAEETFKKIGEAYSVLSDPVKRKHFDKYGKEGVNDGSTAEQRTRGFSSRQADDIFKAFFGGRDPFADLLDMDFFSGIFGKKRQRTKKTKRDR